MRLPSTREGDTEFERFLQTLSPDWERLAVELKAFTRSGKLQTPRELLRTMFQYSGVDLTLRETAAVITLSHESDETISDEGVRKRLIRCLDLAEELVKRALKVDEIPSLPAGCRVLCVDGTVLGGSYSSKKEVQRLHLCIELLTMKFVEVTLSSTKKGESLKNFTFQPRDLVLHDRGYSHIPGIFSTVFDHRAEVLGRWNHGTVLYESQGEEKPIDLFEELKEQKPGSTKTLEVLVKYSEKSKIRDKRKVRGWLHCYRLTPEQAKDASERSERNHERKQRIRSERTKLLCQFVLVFTTLPPQQLSAESALALYRVRWQVELAIKRLKGLLKLNKMRTRPGSRLSKLYIYGKILYTLMLERKTRSVFGEQTFSLEQPRKLTLWRPLKLLKCKLDSLLLQSHTWNDHAWSRCIRALMERPRRRLLQRLPEEVVLLKFDKRIEQLTRDSLARSA